MPSSALDREAIEAEIDRLRSLGLDELRTLWRATFRSPPPLAFAKDLIARFLCCHIQEQAVGELDPDTAKHLDGLIRGDKARADRPRRLKPGTVLVREYQGDRHTVTVVPNGDVWHETTYASLSVIARAITGTAWNGPRFFAGALFPSHSRNCRSLAIRTRKDFARARLLDGRPSSRRGQPSSRR